MGTKTQVNFFIIGLGLMALSGWCQVRGQPLSPIQKIGVEHGLSQTINSFIYQDKKGFVWISSTDGLNRFDGRRVKVFKPEEKNAHAIRGGNIQSPFFEDANGDIWFGTELGLNRYSNRTGYFESYVIGSDTVLTGTHHYAFFLERNQFLWTLANSKLYKFDVKSPLAKPSAIIDTLIAARCGVDTALDGRVKSLYLGLWDYNSGFQTVDFDSNGLPIRKTHFLEAGTKTKPIGKIRQVLTESPSVAWFAGDQGLVEFCPQKRQKINIYPFPGKKSSIDAISFLSNRYLLVANADGLFFMFDKKHKKFEATTLNHFNTNPLNHQNVEGIHLTNDRIAWWGVRKEGVFFTSIKKNKFDKKWIGNCPQESIRGIFEYKNKDVFLSTETNKCYTVANKNCQRSNQKNSRYAKVLVDSKGVIWNVSTTGLSISATGGTNWKTKLAFAESASFMDALLWNDSVMVVGCIQGLMQIDLKKLKIKKISDNTVYSLGKDNKGRLWQGADNQIKVWLQNKDAEFQQVAKIENTGDVLCFVFDSLSATIRVGTSLGLLIFNTQTLENFKISERDGLPNQYIYAVIQDKKGYLWLSTNQGIIRFHPDIKPYQFKQYTTRDGLSSNEYNPGAALMDSRGYLWFGSTKGVDVFHPDSIHDLGHAPQLALVGLKIHDQEWRGDSAVEVVKRIELPYNQNTLRLELAAMEYLDPAYNKFKVLLQLDGEAAKWTDLGTQNFVTYANLKPGKYTFQFIACNAEGIWVEEKDAKTLWFIIHPHWSDTWWFRTLLAVVLLGFVATATAFYYRYQLRAQQLRAEKQQHEAERQRLELEKNAAVAEEQRKVAESEMKLLRSQLNPHFLFNAMNSINRYILSNEREKASEYLGQFAQLTRSILDNSRSLTIPLADELKMLHHYLALENHRFQQNIHWTFTVSPDLDEEDVLVPSMFLQPFAENAILHGLAPKGGGHIAVEISQQEGNLQCVLRDDGVGRQPTAAPADGKPRHASVGMRLIAERLHAFAGLQGQSAAFVLHDLKDEAGQPLGTEVVIRLPLVMAV